MSEHKAKDWARNCCSPQFLIAWGIPISALVLSSSTGIGLAWIWPIGLAWLGIACLLNARRCSRTHCSRHGTVLPRARGSCGTLWIRNYRSGS